MNRVIRTFVLAVGTAFVAVQPSLAAFSGAYEVSNWTATLTGEPVGGGSTIDVADAPNSIQILGGDNGCDQILGLCQFEFAIKASAGGAVLFDWSYSTIDSLGPAFDLFGYHLNGSSVQLSDDAGTNDQVGSASFGVSAGDIFGFWLDCFDCMGGGANVTISNFTAPVTSAENQVPEPSTMMLFSASLLSLGLFLRRRY